MRDSEQQYIHQELRPVEDPTILAAGAALGELRSVIVQSLPSLVERGRGPVSGRSLSVVVGILFRMTETSLSVELLISKGQWRDAATLILSLIELCLDLQYMAADPTCVQTWLDHQEEGRKPWRVARQINAIFRDDDEREAAMANYRRFSMVKHGNPAAGGLGFSIHPGSHNLTLHGNTMNPGISVAYFFSAGVHLRDAISAACELLGGVGVDFSDAMAVVEAHYSVLSQIQHDHISEKLTAIQRERRESGDV